MAAPEAVSTRGMKNQVRIRGPKPDVCHHANSLDELESLLRKHIDVCKSKPTTETVYAQFIFDGSVVFQIKDTSDGIREHFPHLQIPQLENSPGPLPVTEAVAQVPDTKTKLRRQRAVGRAILRSITAIDGFSYFEKEAWDTKHADGYRFKYLCKDSYQNKDRALNKVRKSTDGAGFQSINGGGSGVAGDVSGDQSPAKAESPARLPTYDCKGSIFVKFSSSQQIVDVVYQHLPMHNASNERSVELPLTKPVPTHVNNGTPHEDSADPMDTSEIASYATPQAATPVAAPIVAAVKGKKRKRNSKAARESLIEDESSELEPLDDDWDLENQEPPPPLLSPSWEPDPGDGDLWRPSVVTLIPGIKTQMKQSVRKSYQSAAAVSAHQAAEESSASGSDFEGAKKPTKKKPGPKAKAKAAAAAAAGGTSASNNASATASSAAAATASASTSAAAAAAQDSDRPTRRRTKTGCWTCRSRKLKCDENRPQCTQCARSRPPRDCSFPDDGDEDEDMSDAPPP